MVDNGLSLKDKTTCGVVVGALIFISAKQLKDSRLPAVSRSIGRA